MNDPSTDGLEENRHDSEARVEFQMLCANIGSFAALDLTSQKWDFLGGQEGMLRIEMLPLDFIKAMAQDFSPEELATIGLYRRVGDELQVASWLDNNVDLYVAIDESNETVAFSAGDEFLFPLKRTAVDLGLERNPPDSTQPVETLFIVESPEAVKIMQRLGLQSVSCDGLNDLDSNDVQRLFAGDARSDFGWRYFLMLLNFDVTRFENSPLAAMNEVISRLADAEVVYRVDPSRRFGVSRPTKREFESLERAAAFKDTAETRQVFENWSTAAKSATIGNWRSHLAVETLPFADASTALTHALQLPNGFHRRCAVQAALASYRAAGKEAVMQKFFDAIERTRDPFDQVNMIAAAGFAENFLENDPLVRSAEAVLAGEIPASARELRDECFDQRLRCMAELRRIQRDRQGKRYGG